MSVFVLGRGEDTFERLKSGGNSVSFIYQELGNAGGNPIEKNKI